MISKHKEIALESYTQTLALLRERHIALLHAVVTGKIDERINKIYRIKGKDEI